MQDYMKAFQNQLDRQESDDLNALVEYAHEELKKNMDIVECKKLLRLLDAQKHPENYRNLIVRVWGWSGYFVELNEIYQNHIIKRTEMIL